MNWCGTTEPFLKPEPAARRAARGPGAAAAGAAEAPAGGGKIGGTSGSGSTTGDEDAQTQQDQAASTEQTQQQSTRRVRTASSSTKVSFTGDVQASVPTAESVRGSAAFPWGWVFAGLGALGILAFAAAKIVNKKRG